MKKTSIIFAILLLISFFPYGILSSQASQEFSIDELASEGYSAFVIQGVESEKIPDDSIQECECNGSKVMVHGDGHKTPCQCFNVGDGICRCTKIQLIEGCEFGCKCSSEEKCICESCSIKEEEVVQSTSAVLEEKKVQIIFLTADWCGPCRVFKSNEIPKIKNAGYKYSSKDDADLKEVDYDKDRQTYLKYTSITGKNSVPQFIVEVDGIVKEYWVGGFPANFVINKFKKYEEDNDSI